MRLGEHTNQARDWRVALPLALFGLGSDQDDFSHCSEDVHALFVDHLLHFFGYTEQVVVLAEIGVNLDGGGEFVGGRTLIRLWITTPSFLDRQRD